MNHTEQMYTNDTIINTYNKMFPKAALELKEDVTPLLFIRQGLMGNHQAFKTELLDKINKESKYVDVYKEVINYIDGEYSSKFEVIKETIDTLINYRDITLEYINDKRYNITTKELAEMLDIAEDYISRNLMDNFDYFKMKTIARHTIKMSGTSMDINFLNKKVFLSRESVKKFLKKYLKFSSKKVQIDLTMPDKELADLMAKFKTEIGYRTAIKKAISDLDKVTIELKEQKKEAKKNNLKFTRLDLPLYEIDEEIIQDIIARDITLKSVKTIIAEVKTLERLEFDMSEDAVYNYIGMSSKQAYDILDYNIGTIRFAVDGLTKDTNVNLDEDELKNDLIEHLRENNVYIDENSSEIRINMNDLLNVFKINKKLFSNLQSLGQDSKVERKFLVRYATNIRDLINFRNADQNNYLYSLDADAYKRIIGDLKTDAERREAIIKYFYEKMMKPEFKIYERKKKEEEKKNKESK